MDIAKYIGLYLLKNNFCYIHGLGNLELKKKPATYDGQTLNPPVYDVYLSPTGSIDDNLANFIATFEQTSISKAANSLRDFSMETRAALNEGKEVEIPAIGKFVQQNGVVKFISNPQLQYTPPSIPVLRTARHAEEAPSFKRNEQNDDEGSSITANINWGKIVLWVVIVLAVAAIAIFGLRYMNQNNNSEPVKTVVPAKDTTNLTPPVVTPPPADTMHKDTAAAAPVAAPVSNGPAEMKVVLNTYPTKAAADKRAKTLSGNGNKVEVVSKDSSSFMVVLPITLNPADTAHALDSLRRFFNPKGVHIYH